MSGAKLLVETLKTLGVRYIFGIPGAKIDKVFDELNDSGPELILCRHEQNAAFMAGMMGRLTGVPGVCLVTSGPGCSNLVTGLSTSTSEGEPVIAIGGAVSRSMRLKQTHQTLDAVSMMKAVTKSSVEVETAESIPEAVFNAWRKSINGRPGATFISLPQDVAEQMVEVPYFSAPDNFSLGASPEREIDKAAALLNKSQMPVFLLGAQATMPGPTRAIREFLRRHRLPVVCTYDGAGIITRDLMDCFIGRVGLFRNQPGDRLLEKADLIISVGFDPIEYDPTIWNSGRRVPIIHIDNSPADWDLAYQPEVELIGDIPATVEMLDTRFKDPLMVEDMEIIKKLQEERVKLHELSSKKTGFPIHPMKLISELREMIGDDVTVVCDVGSIYIWIARYFLAHEPRRLIFSNGQQTLGVALPRAIAASLAHPGEKVISMSGDGGFLFSAMELETAVRLKSNLVHFVWVDGTYDMVRIQQMIKYGRESAVRFGPVDIVSFAKSFGAKGFRIGNSGEIKDVIRRAMEVDGPALVEVPIDYSDNQELARVTRDTVIY